MLIEHVKNPMNNSQNEDIVRITMTRDQFSHLKDCVSLAWQEANQNSRMFLISTMIRDDFDKLAMDIGKSQV
jgi:hypothetical protein